MSEQNTDRLATLRLTDGCRCFLRMIQEIKTIKVPTGTANVCTVEVQDLGGAEVDDSHESGENNPPNVYTLWPTDKLAGMMRAKDMETEGDFMVIRRRGAGKATRWFVKDAGPPEPEETEPAPEVAAKAEVAAKGKAKAKAKAKAGVPPVAGPPEGMSDEDIPF